MPVVYPQAVFKMTRMTYNREEVASCLLNGVQVVLLPPSNLRECPCGSVRASEVLPAVGGESSLPSVRIEPNLVRQ